MPSNPESAPMNKALGDEKMSSPAGNIKTESSVPFDGFSPLNNDHEERQEEAIKNFTQQLPNVETVPEVDGPASPLSGEQTSTMSSDTPVAPTSTSVKIEVQTPLSEMYKSRSPGAEMVPPAQEQSIVKEETGLHAAVAAAEPKTEDVEDTSRNSTPFPAHLNPGMNQDEDSQLSFNQESQSETSIFAVRWPKDKVVIQRLDQLCECVLKGEWPIVSKVADALLQNQLVANSPLSGGYPSLGDVEMASLPPGFAIGEDGQPEDPSKAFKLKRLDGLKLTFKKNKRKRKRDAEMGEGLSEDGGLVYKEPGEHKMPARVDGEWNESMMNMEAPGHDFRMDPAMGIKPPRKKRVSKKEKGEKPEKPPTGKKRGRKPKTDKLGSAGRLADTGGAGVTPDGAALEWTGFSLTNRMEGGVKQVPVIEEVSAGHARAVLSKSPRESGTNPAYAAFSDEITNSRIEGESRGTSGQEEYVAVIDRETGRKLVGNAAPTLANLVDWLQQNSSYDVAEECTAFVRSKGILPASLLNRLSRGAKRSNPTTPTAVGQQTSHHLYGSYNEMNYGTAVSKSQFDSSSLSTSLTSTATSSTHTEPTRASFPYDSSHFGNFPHAMPFGPFGHVPYYASYGVGMPANSQGTTSFGENASSKPAQSPVSPNPSSSQVIFNNSYSSLYAGQQPGNGLQGYAPGMASNAFSFPLMNNGNLASSPLSSKGDFLPDSASHGSSSIGSDVSSQGSPDNDC